MIYLSFKPEQASYKGDQSNQVKHNFVPAGLFFYQVFDGYYGKKQAQEVIKIMIILLIILNSPIR